MGPPAESTEALRKMACNNRGEPVITLYCTVSDPFARNTVAAENKMATKQLRQLCQTPNKVSHPI